MKGYILIESLISMALLSLLVTGLLSAVVWIRVTARHPGFFSEMSRLSQIHTQMVGSNSNHDLKPKIMIIPVDSIKTRNSLPGAQYYFKSYPNEKVNDTSIYKPMVVK